MKYCTNSPGCEEDHCRCDDEIEKEVIIGIDWGRNDHCSNDPEDGDD